MRRTLHSALRDFYSALRDFDFSYPGRSEWEASLLLWLRTPLPPKRVLSLTLLFLFGGALLGYLASFPYLQYWFSVLAYEAPEKEHYGGFLWRTSNLQWVLEDWWGILRGNAFLFALIALFWVRYPRASQYALFLIAFRSGLLASPYDQIVINSLAYTIIFLLVGTLEFTAYAYGASGRFRPGAGLLLVSSVVEEALIFLLL